MRRLVTRRTTAFVLIVCAVVYNGCKGSNNGSDAGSGFAVLKASVDMDFSKVQAILVAPVSSENTFLNFQDSDTPPSLAETIYALNEDGSLSVVEILENADASTEFKPLAMHTTLKYVFFTYENVRSPTGQFCKSVALRKVDGALFCITVAPNYHVDYNVPIRTDATGDLVYINATSLGLNVLNFTSAEPTLKLIVDAETEAGVYAFAVNDDGDVLVGLSGVSNRSLRVYLANGGFKNISAGEGDCLTNGVGENSNNFYYMTTISAANVNYKLQKLTKNGNEFANTTIYEDANGAFGIKGCRLTGGLAKTKAAIYIIAPHLNGLEDSNYFLEVYSDDTPIKHVVAGVEEIERLAGFDNGLILQGADAQGNAGLKRFLSLDGSYADLLEPGDYTVTKLSASKDGAATFSGRRSADNGRIVGNIEADGTDVTVIMQSLSTDVQIIERL